MNTKLIKFYLKDDLKGTLVYMLGLSIIIFTIGLVVDSMPEFSIYINVINNGFPFVSFGYFVGVYFIILNKTTSEQWENFSLTKNEKFNLLAIRYAVSMLIPQTIILIISGYLNNQMTPDMVWTYIPWVLQPTLFYVFAMYAVFVSGNIATAILGISFSAIIVEIIIEKQVENARGIEPAILLIFTLILICLVFFVNKKIFQKRHIEKLGKMFLFRWAEVIFTIGVATAIAAVLNGILIDNTASVLDYIVVALGTILIYTLTDLAIITGLKVEKLMIKFSAFNLLIQCLMGVVISIIVSVLIALY